MQHILCFVSLKFNIFTNRPTKIIQNKLPILMHTHAKATIGGTPIVGVGIKERDFGQSLRDKSDLNLKLCKWEKML